MKIKLLTLTLLLTSIAISQNLQLGPEIGMNLIRLDKNKIGNNYQPSWHVGLAAEYEVYDWLSIKSGLFYTQKRQAYSSKDTSTSDFIGLLGVGDLDQIDFNTYTEIEGRHTQNFIQLPIMASFNYEGFSLLLGGYVGFQFSSRTRENKISKTPFVSTIDIATIDPSGAASNFLPAPTVDTYTESSNSATLNLFDVGIKGGVGYKMDKVGINISYLYGLTDYRNIQGNNKRQNHKYIQLTMNYMLGFGKIKQHSFAR